MRKILNAIKNLFKKKRKTKIDKSERVDSIKRMLNIK
jgi:hypothetical protein